MACEKKCFTFIWKLENASYFVQKKWQFIESPAFMVAEIDETKWKLWLFPRGSTDDGNCIGYFLHREWDSKGADNVEIKYDLAFLAKDGPVLKSVRETISFTKNKSFGYADFEKRANVFILKRSEYLPEDTLTARCRIWKSVGEMDDDVRCLARTRIGIEKSSFLWNVDNFSNNKLGKEENYQIKSLLNDIKLMSLKLYLGGGQNCEEIIRFKVTCHDESIKYCTFRLSVVKTDKTQSRCHQDEIWFDRLSDSHHFTLYFSRQVLMKNLPNLPAIYLTGDILSLKWEWVFSKGIVSEEIEEVQF